MSHHQANKLPPTPEPPPKPPAPTLGLSPEKYPLTLPLRHLKINNRYHNDEAASYIETS